MPQHTVISPLRPGVRVRLISPLRPGVRVRVTLLLVVGTPTTTPAPNPNPNPKLKKLLARQISNPKPSPLTLAL